VGTGSPESDPALFWRASSEARRKKMTTMLHFIVVHPDDLEMT
jgi:hypothetical protein